MHSRTTALLVSTAIGLISVLSAGGACAQAQESSEVDEVVVTGSLISRSDITSASPISVISAETIVDAGVLSVSEVLKQDPSLGVNSRGTALTLNGAGQSNVNLRNLGASRTLALVNGRRIPLFSDVLGNASQDTSIIPTMMLQRVDVLRDGASTTYGADAVAGVVNFILRDRFEGFQAEAYYGQSDRGDGEAYRLSAVAGANFDRGSVIVSASYQDQDPILLSRRSWARPAIQSLAPVGVNTYGSNSTPGGYVFGPGPTTGAPLACADFSGGGKIPVAGGCPRYDSSVETSLGAGSTLRVLGMVARYDLTDDIRFSADMFNSRRNSYQSISAAQIDTSGLTGAYPVGFVIPRTNSNNPYGADVRLRWRPSSYGSRPTIALSDTSFINVGLDGSLFNRFKWNLSHTYSVSDSDQRTENQVNSVALFNLLNPTACNADQICRTVAPVANIASLLSGAARLTAAQEAYLFYDSKSSNRYSSAQTVATLSGPLFSLPAGQVQFAVGLERRKETGSIHPDAITQSGAAIGSFVFPSDGRFTTNEAFGELDIPLVKDAPLVQDLTLNVQGRYSDFSNFGGAKTYKIGLNYTPVEGVRFRTAYGTSFRAPDVIQLYGGGVGATGAIIDPCNFNGLRASNAQVAANCATLGVPAGFFQLSNALPTRSGGNPSLQPERGRTFTFGVVLQPEFLPGFSATIDYYEIKIRDAIGAGNTQTNLNNCYASTDLISRSADENDICFSFGSRQPNGALDRILTRSINIAQNSTSGVDFNLRYHTDELPSVPGSLTSELRLSYLKSFKSQGLELAGLFSGGVDGSSAFPQWRGNLTTTYGLGDWDVEWQVNYVDAIRDQNVGTSIPVNNFKNYTGVPRYFTHDVLVRWRPMEDLRVSVGVNNMFDKDPPYAFVLTRNAIATVHDQVGRYFFMTVQKKF